jgi:hypothetical protein
MAFIASADQVPRACRERARASGWFLLP